MSNLNNNIQNTIKEAIDISLTNNPCNHEIHFLLSNDFEIKNFSLINNIFSDNDGVVISVTPYSEGDILEAFPDAFLKYYNEKFNTSLNCMCYYNPINIVSSYNNTLNEKIASICTMFALIAARYHSYEDGVYIVFDKKNFVAIDIVVSKKIYKTIDKNIVPIYINSSKHKSFISLINDCKKAIENSLNYKFDCDMEYDFELVEDIDENYTDTLLSKQDYLISNFKNAFSETDLHNLILSAINITDKHKLFGKTVHFRISNNFEILSASLNYNDVAGNDGLTISINNIDTKYYWEKITDQFVSAVNMTFDRNFRYTHWYEVNNKKYMNKKFDSKHSYRFAILDFEELPDNAKAIYFV